jgi:hypothetical protein
MHAQIMPFLLDLDRSGRRIGPARCRHCLSSILGVTRWSDANAITTGETSGYDLNRPVSEGNGTRFFTVHNTTSTTG